MDLKGIVWQSVGWIYLAQGRGYLWALLSMLVKFWVPLNEGNFVTS
jgi:hypothetical protein